MSRWLFAVLFVPLCVVIVLTTAIVRVQNDRYNEVIAATEVASLATDINELDQALGAEALAGTKVISDPSRWDLFVVAYADRTDLRLEILEGRPDAGRASMAEAIVSTREVLRFRNDLRSGLISPLQLADRYAQPREQLLDVLVESEIEETLQRMTALIEARSAHLDERFSSELALTYRTWAPGQYSSTTATIAIESDRIDVANKQGGEPVALDDAVLNGFREHILLTPELPDLAPGAYAEASDRWLAALNAEIEREARAIETELQQRADDARRARLVTVVGALVGALLAFFAAGFVSYRIVDRLRHLSLFARRFANGERRIGTVSSGLRGKDEIVELARAFDEMIDEVGQRDRRLAIQAQTDQMTGLLNRGAILERWERLIARPNGSAFAFAIDLDGFKPINDQYGHQAGDQVLTVVADRLRHTVHAHRAVVGRLGGDEFLAVFDRAADADSPRLIAEGLLEAVQQPIDVSGMQVSVDASIGIVESRVDATATQLLHEADSALYAAKSGGGGEIRASDAQLRRTLELFETERAEIRSAVERGEFDPAFQSIRDLSGAVVGFEVLARWQRPDGSLVGPASFMGVVAHERLFPELDLLMLRLACEAWANWEHVDGCKPTLSVNVSAEFLESPEFVSVVLGLVHENQVQPSSIVLEITESGLMEDSVSSAQKLDEVRDAGLRVSIDDYGTGYSTLAYLQQLPVDSVKLDRHFVHRIEENATSQAIARSVMALTSDLDVGCIIEGVETQAEFDWFARHGASLVQGFLFDTPSDLASAQTLFEAHGVPMASVGEAA